MAERRHRRREQQIPTLAPPRPASAPPDAAAAVAGALGELDALGEGDELLIIVNDPQRHTDTALVLGRLDELRRRGAAPGRWRILVACGTHRFDGAAAGAFEKRLAATSEAIASIDWHDCRSADLRPAGRAPSSWRGHPLLAETGGPILAVGSVEPHYFAGLTGAHKTATIGCAAFEAIEANHAGAMSPAAAPFALDGNPVFDGVRAMLEELERRRPVAAVNLIQTGPTVRAVAAGEPIETLGVLGAEAEAIFARTIDAPADALVLEVEGPLAGSFYQADKALKNAENAVRDGGLLVLAAACGAGVGQDHFTALMRQADGYEQAMAVVAARGYRLGDHKAVRLRRLTDPAQRGVRIAAVSDGLDERACSLLGMTKAPDAAAALGAAGIDARRDRVFRVKDAGNTVVRLAAEAEELTAGAAGGKVRGYASTERHQGRDPGGG